MGGKLAVSLGLLAGVVVGGLLVGGAIALVPGPALSPALPAAPSAVPTSAPPATSVPEATPGPSVVPASPSPVAPSASPSASPSAGPSAAGAFNIGQPAPPLQLPVVGGGTVDLASLRGKPVWVNFMATWCLPCRDELPLMQGYAARYEDEGLVVLLVDAQEDEAVVRAFLDDLNVYLPATLDADGSAQAAWAATALPVHFFIDADGIVREWALGGLGPDLMAVGLQAIMPDVEVTP